MLRKFFLVLCIALTYSFSAKSSHIIGGEINLVHIAKDSFRLSLHVFYDEVNSVSDIVDNQVEIYAFSEATSQVVETFTLPKNLDRELPYTSIRCRLGNFITREVIYSKIIKLDSTKYDQSAGYYLTWEQCCRNGVIDNIENPEDMGITVSLDFPSLMQDGKFMPNSSPVFSSLVGDYACLNQWYFVDFEATDADGDELQFSLVNPLRGNATRMNNNPIPQPKPYDNPSVTWKSLQGYSVNTQVRGAPSLELQPSGRLRVKPVERGLFVFAVKCEEFRNGKKIGQKIREFQILVQECTSVERHFPEVNAYSNPSSINPISSSDTIIFEMDDMDKRIYLKVTDQDADSVRLRALPVRTKTGQFSQGAILTDTLGFLQNSTDNHLFSVSYPHCPEKSGGVYADRFVISDLTCGQPYEDTVTVFVRVKEKLHEAPFISAVTDSTNSVGEFIFEGVQSDSIVIPLKWIDDDRDSLVYLDFRHFRDSLPQNPFTDSLQTYPAIAHDTLFWKVPCDLFEGVTDSTLSFHFPIIVTDFVRCGFEKTDTAKIQIFIRNRQIFNTKPKIIRESRLPISDTLAVYADTAYLNKPYKFELDIADTEGGSILVSWEAENFSAEKINFPINSIQKDSLVNLRIDWLPDCSFLEADSIYKTLKINIFIKDFSVCDTLIFSDTVKLDLVLTSDNQKPNTWTNLPDKQYDIALKDSVYSDSIRVNVPYQFSIKYLDFEEDSVEIYFKTDLDTSKHKVKFHRNDRDTSQHNEHFWQWTPNCDYFSNPDSIYPVSIEFIAMDLDTCSRRKSDTLQTILYVLPDQERAFEPYFFTNLDSIFTQFYVDTAEVGSVYSLKMGAVGLGSLIMEDTILSTHFQNITPKFTSVVSLDSIQTNWTWNLSCSYFSDLDSLPKYLDLQFEIEANSCNKIQTDMAKVRVFLRYPEEKNNLQIIQAKDTIEQWQTEILAGYSLDFFAFSNIIPNNTILNIKPDFDTLKNSIQTKTIRKDSVLLTHFLLQTECTDELKNLQLQLILEDTSVCSFGVDTALIFIKVLPTPPENQAPNLTFNSDLNFDTTEKIYTDSVFLGEKFTLRINGKDPDSDSLFLIPIAQNFNFTEVGFDFLSISARADFSTVITWQTSCKNLNIKDKYFESKNYEFDVILKDRQPCLPEKIQIARIRWTVLGWEQLHQLLKLQTDLPQNSEGVFEATLVENELFEAEFLLKNSTNNIELHPIDWIIQGDNFLVEDMGVVFTPVSDSTASLSWTPSCDLVKKGADFQFFITAKTPLTECLPEIENTLKMRLNLETSQTDFQHLTNVLTPNGDGKNDIFRLPNILDNCNRQTLDFQKIEIFNRWGNRVFESTNPEFEWTPDNVPAGVYFYALKFVNQEVMQGVITIIK